MKSHIAQIAIAILLTTSIAFSQNVPSVVELGNAPMIGTGLQHVQTFVIGLEAYVFGGFVTHASNNTMYEQNQVILFNQDAKLWNTNTVKEFPSNCIDGSTFTIGETPYVVAFRHGVNGAAVADNHLWYYDKVANEWYEVFNNGVPAILPGVGRSRCYSFGLKGKGYVGGGIDANGNPYKELYEYDPSNKTWNLKQGQLPIHISEASIFVINDFAYIIGGRSGTSKLKTVYKYDPNQDLFISLGDLLPIGRQGAVGFSMNGKGYIAMGLTDNGYSKDIYEFNPQNQSWKKLVELPTNYWGRAYGCGFVIGDKFYYGGGTDEIAHGTVGVETTQFFEFSNLSSVAIKPYKTLIGKRIAQSTEFIQIDLNLSKYDNVKIELLDLLGRNYSQQNLSGNTIHYSMNIANYSKGIYILRITGNGWTDSQKILVN